MSLSKHSGAQRPTLSAIALSLILAACGGGGGSSGNGSGLHNQAPIALALSASTDQTLAGGRSITLTGKTDSGSALAWSLAAGSPGSLSSASGASVSYTPPANVTANTPVKVTVTVNGISKSVVLTVFPEPGAPGLSIISGRLNSDMLDATADGPAASARFRQSLGVASDLAGNLYVAGTCRLTSTRLQGMSLRKIGTDGMVSTLASCESSSWFGKSDTGLNLQQIYLPRGIAVDRAGNMYTASYFSAGAAGTASLDTSAVFKITPQGVMTVLAGATGAHTLALTDGKGGAARFLSPEIAGIDGDDNLYVLDKEGSVVRKITPDGEVGTVAALPPSLKADQDGNTYRAEYPSGAVIRTTPGGADSTLANVNTLPGVLSGMTPRPYGLVRTGPASYALIVGNGYTFPNEAIVRLVVPH